MVEWNPLIRDPQIAKHMFGQTAQRCFFFGKSAWASIGLGLLCLMLAKYAKQFNHINIFDNLMTFYAIFMAAAMGAALLGLVNAYKSFKTSDNFSSNTALVHQKAFNRLKQKMIKGVGLCLSSILMIVFVMYT